MRIAHVVTYISEEGAFGGPVAVAMAQTQALAEQGHDVELFAGWDGAADVDLPGVTVRLFKVRRFGRLSSLVSLRLAAHLRAERNHFDVFHLHFGRDLISLSAWAVLRAIAPKVVLQPHGMVQPDPRTKARVVDRLLVRSALGHAKAVLALTEGESVALASVAAFPLRCQMINNGIAVPESADLERRSDAPVLFLARLHPRKNVMFFAEAARTLREQGADLRFRVVGPDEGDLEALQSFIGHHRLQGFLDYAGVVGPGGATGEMRRARLYVLPSIGEIYPMTVLEALAQGTPVVLGNDSALSAPLSHARAALVIEPSASTLAEAIIEATRDESFRTTLARTGHAFAHATFDIGGVAQRLTRLYESQ